jgi:hypothetical protein
MEKKGEVSTGTLHLRGVAPPELHHGADLGDLPLVVPGHGDLDIYCWFS